jgi:hypothetical protein
VGLHLGQLPSRHYQQFLPWWHRKEFFSSSATATTTAACGSKVNDTDIVKIDSVCSAICFANFKTNRSSNIDSKGTGL